MTTTDRLTPERERVARTMVRAATEAAYVDKWPWCDFATLLRELDAVRAELDAERIRALQQRGVSRAETDAERWNWYADSAERERSSNGDNEFVRYVGPWVIAEYHHDAADGDYVTPGTPDEWIDAVRAEGSQ